MSRRVHWRFGYVGYTAIYLLPYIRVGKVFAFVGWWRFEAGFYMRREG